MTNYNDAVDLIHLHNSSMFDPDAGEYHKICFYTMFWNKRCWLIICYSIETLYEIIDVLVSKIFAYLVNAVARDLEHTFLVCFLL